MLEKVYVFFKISKRNEGYLAVAIVFMGTVNLRLFKIFCAFNVRGDSSNISVYQ